MEADPHRHSSVGHQQAVDKHVCRYLEDRLASHQLGEGQMPGKGYRDLTLFLQDSREDIWMN